MPRLFVALRPPAPVHLLLEAAMTGVPEARWQDDDQLHLTLRFIGEVERRQTEDIAAALGHIGGHAIEARIAGVGRFERGGRTDTLWAGVEPREPLATLHRKVDRALVQAGMVPERRAYVPHVTLARLTRSARAEPAVERWCTDHSLLTSEPFLFDRLILYESTLGRTGVSYEPRAFWPLESR